MGDNMKKEYGLSDALIGRVLNVIQEAMISGVDVLDLFREMRMRPSDDDPHVLVLTDEYKMKVDTWHKQIEQDLQQRKEFLDNNQEGRVFLHGTGPDTGEPGKVVPVVISFDTAMVSEKKTN